MKINIETKVVARLHTQANGTGLNIYNPYFQDQNLNVVYLLFQNLKPDPLVDGIRRLNLAGAITAGFEHDPHLPKLVDKTTEAVKLAKRVGIIINKDGKLTAHYQGGEGLSLALGEKTKLKGRDISIVGAGTVAKTLILALENSKSDSKISIYNRTLKNAKDIQAKFKSVKQIGTLDDLRSAAGDILINASRIGSEAEDIYYNKDLVSKFKAVSDVTFGVESTNLTRLAKKQSKVVISGWDMFTHQAVVVLREILGHNADVDRLRYFVKSGLSTLNHGKTVKKSSK